MKQLYLHLLVSCATLSLFQGAITQSDIQSLLKGELYFSIADFGYSDSAHAGRLIWYSNALHDLGEPILLNKETGYTIYRFSHIGSRGGSYSVRVEKRDSTYALEYKSTAGRENKSTTITEKQWKKLERKLQRIHFWELKTRDGRQGHDGFNWIIEGSKAGNYHAVDRWLPKTRSRYRKTCDYLLQLSLQDP